MTGSEPELSVRLLGRFEVRVRGHRIDERAWHLRRAADVVKLLALAPDQTLRRDTLLEWLWPALSPEAAGNNLRQALYVARKVLDADSHGRNGFLVRRGQSVRLTSRSPALVDVDAFESAARAGLRAGDIEGLARASQLYTGELLPDDEYEDWSIGRRRALATIYLDVLAALSRECETRGRPQAAIEALERLVATDPASELGRVELMRLRALTGDRKRALDEYGTLCRELETELGVKPSDKTEELRAAILSNTLTR